MPSDDHRTTIGIPQKLIALIEEIRTLSRRANKQILPRGQKLNRDVIWLATEHAKQVRDELLALDRAPARRRPMKPR